MISDLPSRRTTDYAARVRHDAPLVSLQEVPRRLEHVYLKTMADAQGVAYAA